MTKTLLNAVNETLKRTGVIAGDSGEFTSLTDSARQVLIDLAVQVVQEGVDDLYLTAEKPLPEGRREGTLTLSNRVRAYKLRDDLVRLRWPMIDRTNHQYIHEASGGYDQLLLSDADQDDTGLPVLAAIRPTDGRLHLDRAPTAIEAGRAYKYQYDRDISLEAAGDLLPFADAVFRAMVPVWAEYWKRSRRLEFDESLFRTNLGRAAGLLTKSTPRTSYWSGR